LIACGRGFQVSDYPMLALFLTMTGVVVLVGGLAWLAML
jgi:hypothetical protein